MATWVVVSKIFWEFSFPNLGEDEPNLTSIFFQMGWNHQLATRSCFVCYPFFFVVVSGNDPCLSFTNLEVRCDGFLTIGPMSCSLSDTWNGEHPKSLYSLFSPSFLRGELANFGGVFKIMPIAKIQGKHPQTISLDRAFHHWHAWCWNTSLMIDTSTE